jgi:hypothetical protein
MIFGTYSLNSGNLFVLGMVFLLNGYFSRIIKYFLSINLDLHPFIVSEDKN